MKFDKEIDEDHKKSSRINPNDPSIDDDFLSRMHLGNIFYSVLTKIFSIFHYL